MIISVLQARPGLFFKRPAGARVRTLLHCKIDSHSDDPTNSKKCYLPMCKNDAALPRAARRHGRPGGAFGGGLLNKWAQQTSRRGASGLALGAAERALTNGALTR
jgi:hypothetical protein